MNLKKLAKEFANPPANLRSMPLWVWNGEVSEKRITQMLEQFATRGFGGVFVHPRPGLVTEYLSDRWFKLWKHALTECKRLNLLCNIYDENSYPSGFAGGNVSSRIPQAAMQYLAVRTAEKAPLNHSGEILAAYDMSDPEKPKLLKDFQRLEQGDFPLLAVELCKAPGNPWLGGFPYMDLTHPEVAPEFIASTHEEYWKRFKGDFGRSIQAIFCDEPLLGMVAAGSTVVALPFSYGILAQFHKQNGYDIRPRLIDLFVDSAQASQTRFDYFLTVQRLWETNFLQQISEWCTKGNVKFTGHYMEHEWPHPFFHPDTMSAYRWMDVPGIDLLAPQFDFANPQNSALYLMTVRECASVVSQLGKAGMMCETHGVGGHDATFEDFKRLSDWLMVHGVDFIVQHLSFETICGARKYDHPQTFSDHSPWWDDYALHADHVARLQVLLRQGKRIARTLVLQPTTSGWLHGSPTSAVAHEKRERLRQSQAALVQTLADAQIDFDLGDELLMADMGRAEKGKLSIGQCSYSLVIVPEHMDNWCRSTLELIRKFLEQGGTVLVLGMIPEYLDGNRSDEPAVMAGQFEQTWIHVKPDDAIDAIRDRIEPLVAQIDGSPLPALISHQAREFDTGERLHMLVNSGHAPWIGKMCLRGAAAISLNTLKGKVEVVENETQGKLQMLEVYLPSAGHAVFITGDRLKTEEVTRKAVLSPSAQELQLEYLGARRPNANILSLDFCDLSVAGAEHKGLYVTRANRECWRAHGHSGDPWDRTIQYRRQYIDRTYPKDSGFLAKYHFLVAQNSAEVIRGEGRLELGLERPEKYNVRVNGTNVKAHAGRPWFDETMKAVPIGNFIKPGLNDISIEAKPFDVLCEIDRLYLIGEFGLREAETGFELIEPQELAQGDWTRQGLVMYSGSVRYSYQVHIDKPGRLVIKLPEWKGSVARVLIDDTLVGLIGFPPYELSIQRAASAAPEKLTIEVVGTLKNLLGPHFLTDPGQKQWPGPAAWDKHPAQPVPGSAYEILPYGLMQDPIVTLAS